MVSPQTASKVVTGMNAFYGLSLLFTDFSLKNYGETTEMARLWYKWVGVSFMWSFVPFAILALKNQNDDAKLRNMLSYVGMMTMGNLAMMVAAGPKSAGGIFVDKEHLINTVFNFAMIPFLASVVNTGPRPVAEGPLPKLLTTPVKQALALNAAAFLFWFIDFATLSPVTKYCTGCDISDPYLYDATRWFVMSIVQGIAWISYTIYFEDAEGQKTIATWYVAMNCIIEYLIRFSPLGTETPEGAVMEGTILRVVLLGSLAWSLQGGKAKSS